MKLALLVALIVQTSISTDLEMVNDLKTLLMDSVRNTIALNELVTHQTQQVSELMLSLSTIQTKLHRMEQENKDTVSRVVQLEKNQAMRNDTDSKPDIISENGVIETELTALRESLEKQLEAVRSEVQDIGSEVMILNGEESNGGCAKVCSGTTGRRTSDWSGGSSHVTLTVDMSGCGFVRVPTITTAIEGESYHWKLTGTSSVYSATATSFSVSLRADSGAERSFASITTATDNKWNVEWIAVGFTC